MPVPSGTPRHIARYIARGFSPRGRKSARDPRALVTRGRRRRASSDGARALATHRRTSGDGTRARTARGR
ncbi:hypothetical protein GW17_00012008 [Ensete ventricosum]|nr:hypothetical protein GW17_00012008 [Ensete ventricosum]